MRERICSRGFRCALRGGRVILRIEDIDSPRIKPGADQQAMDDLRWLGLDWDEGPDVGGPHAPYVQTQRVALYHAALEELKQRERVYPCTCTRSDVAAAASAPHVGQEGPLYPGTCAGRRAADAEQLGDRPFAWRFRTDDRQRDFVDLSLARSRAMSRKSWATSSSTNPTARRRINWPSSSTITRWALPKCSAAMICCHRRFDNWSCTTRSAGPPTFRARAARRRARRPAPGEAPRRHPHRDAPQRRRYAGKTGRLSGLVVRLVSDR